MQTKKGMPVAGALLGALAGLIVALILQVGGIVPATRLVLFGSVGLAMAIGSLVLTIVYKRVAFIVVQVIAIAILGFGLTGIPAMNATGALTGGCTLEGTSTWPDTATPDSTSVMDPFTVDPEGELAWSGTTPQVFTDWDSAISLDVGGFKVRLWSDTNPNDGGATEWGNVEDVAGYIADIESTTGISLSGVYHLYGNLDAQGQCAMDGYIVIPPDNLFDGLVLIILWVLLVIIVIVMIVLVIVVCGRRRAIARGVGEGSDADAAAEAAEEDLGESLGEQDMSR